MNQALQPSMSNEPLKITPLNFTLCGARVWIETDDPETIRRATDWWKRLTGKVESETRIDRQRHEALTQGAQHDHVRGDG